MKFVLVSMECDPVKIYASENRAYKIYKRGNAYTLKGNFSVFNILGDDLGIFNTLKEAIRAAQ